MIRLLHTADLHLGKPFGRFPEDLRGRLREARHASIGRLAAAARANGVADILVAGDTFDSQTPSPATLRQALQAMAADPGITWWLLPGNHDSLAAGELWQRIVREAPPNVRPLLSPEAVEMAPGAFLLPAPGTQRRPGRDLTAGMAEVATPAGALRIGLAHGAVQSFSEDGNPALIPPDRAETAGLAFLALGDWHGQLRIGARTWYAGTPEADGFKHAAPPGALVVTLAGAHARGDAGSDRRPRLAERRARPAARRRPGRPGSPRCCRRWRRAATRCCGSPPPAAPDSPARRRSLARSPRSSTTSPCSGPTGPASPSITRPPISRPSARPAPRSAPPPTRSASRPTTRRCPRKARAPRSPPSPASTPSPEKPHEAPLDQPHATSAASPAPPSASTGSATGSTSSPPPTRPASRRSSKRCRRCSSSRPLGRRRGAALRPYAGGAPEVAAEVELGGARYRIAKRWLQRAFARVTELACGRIIAQDDEAEAWIADRIAGDGPAELLWVRQGDARARARGPQPGGEGRAGPAARGSAATSSPRSRASSTPITGGRRMDAIAARCEPALAEIATATGRPKAGGRWRRAEDEAAALRGELARLDAQCADLAAALAERAEVREELAGAGDPAAAQARTDALAEAERAAEAARVHQSRLEAARSAQRAAALERDAAAAALDAHDRTTRRLADAEAAAAAARDACRVDRRSARHSPGRGTWPPATRPRRRAAATPPPGGRSMPRNARRAPTRRPPRRRARRPPGPGGGAARGDRGRRRRSAGRRDVGRRRRRRRGRPPPISIAPVTRLEAGAVTLAVAYLPGVAQRVTIDGRPVEPGTTVACAGPTTLDLPGIGRLTLGARRRRRPAPRAEAAAAEAALEAILAPAAAADLAALTALAERRAAAEARAAHAAAELAGLAPAGDRCARGRDRPRPGGGRRRRSGGARPGRRGGGRSRGPRRRSRRRIAPWRRPARRVSSPAHADTAAQEKREIAERALGQAAANAAALAPRAGLAGRLDARRAEAAAADRTAADLEPGAARRRGGRDAPGAGEGGGARGRAAPASARDS